MPIARSIRSWRTEYTIERARTLTETWSVDYVPLEGEDPRTAIYESGLVPRRGEVHPTIAGLYCQRVNVGSQVGATTWEVAVAWSTPSAERPPTDPTLAPPTIRFTGENTQEVMEVDAAGSIVTNTAGEPFDPPLMRPLADLVLSYSYNAFTINVPWLLSFANKTNSDDWPGVCAAGEALMDGAPECVLVPASEDFPAYWTVTLKIRFRINAAADASTPAKSAWAVRVLNQGYTALDETYERIVVKDAEGYPLNRPSLLDESGRVSTAPFWLWFRLYDETPFAPLNIVLP